MRRARELAKERGAEGHMPTILRIYQRLMSTKIKKAAALPEGHISTRKDGSKWKKVGPDDWEPVTEGRQRAAEAPEKQKRRKAAAGGAGSKGKAPKATASGHVYPIEPHGKLGMSAGFELHVAPASDGKVKISQSEGGPGPTITRGGLRQLFGDLRGRVAGEKHGSDERINAVLSDKADFLGKGDDGLAFKVGDDVVKVSTTVPFQPFNDGHRTPEQAVEMLRGQAELGNKLADQGVPTLTSEFVEHDGRGYQIKQHVEIPEKLTREQLDEAQSAVLKLHEAGYSLNDTVQVGVTSDGEVVLYDIGKAAKHKGGDGPMGSKRGDIDSLRKLYRDNGEKYAPTGQTKAEKALQDVESRLSDAFIDSLSGKFSADDAAQLEHDIKRAVGAMRLQIMTSKRGDERAKAYADLDEKHDVMKAELDFLAEDMAADSGDVKKGSGAAGLTGESESVQKGQTYTKPKLRERLKRQIMEGSRGGSPGQWSARKAQLLAAEYEKAGGGYVGGKKKSQRSLSKWTRQEWTTASGKPSAKTGEVYAPKRAIAALQSTAAGRKKLRDATAEKKRATARGEQYASHGLHEGKDRSGAKVQKGGGQHKVPESARNNARKVLRWREQHGDRVRGMTPVGWARARQLASQTHVSTDTVKRMAQFARHRKNAAIDPKHKDEPWRDAGYVAWLGWGGTSGVEWARGVSAGLQKGRRLRGGRGRVVQPMLSPPSPQDRPEGPGWVPMPGDPRRGHHNEVTGACWWPSVGDAALAIEYYQQSMPQGVRVYDKEAPGKRGKQVIPADQMGHHRRIAGAREYIAKRMRDHQREMQTQKGGTGKLGRLVTALRKAKGHKYIARIPTGKKRPKYRYIYNYRAKHRGSSRVKLLDHRGTWDKPHPIGTSFADGSKGEHSGHWTVVEHGDPSTGVVVIEHSETGEKKLLGKPQLAQFIERLHESGIDKEEARRLEQASRWAHDVAEGVQQSIKAFRKSKDPRDLLRFNTRIKLLGVRAREAEWGAADWAAAFGVDRHIPERFADAAQKFNSLMDGLALVNFTGGVNRGLWTSDIAMLASGTGNVDAIKQAVRAFVLWNALNDEHAWKEKTGQERIKVNYEDLMDAMREYGGMQPWAWNKSVVQQALASVVEDQGGTLPDSLGHVVLRGHLESDDQEDTEKLITLVKDLPVLRDDQSLNRGQGTYSAGRLFNDFITTPLMAATEPRPELYGKKPKLVGKPTMATIKSKMKQLNRGSTAKQAQQMLLKGLDTVELRIEQGKGKGPRPVKVSVADALAYHNAMALRKVETSIAQHRERYSRAKAVMKPMRAVADKMVERRGKHNHDAAYVVDHKAATRLKREEPDAFNGDRASFSAKLFDRSSTGSPFAVKLREAQEAAAAAQKRIKESNWDELPRREQIDLIEARRDANYDAQTAEEDYNRAIKPYRDRLRDAIVTAHLLDVQKETGHATDAKHAESKVIQRGGNIEKQGKVVKGEGYSLDTDKHGLKDLLGFIHPSVAPAAQFYIVDGRPRAFCRRGQNGGSDQILIGTKSSAVTAWHEFGHAIEHQSDGITEAANALRDQRAGGKKRKTLRAVTGNRRFRKNETTYEDEWRNPYTGKWYGHQGSTELLSIGVQYLRDDPNQFAQEDPEHYAFTIAALTGKFEKPEEGDGGSST